MISRTLLTSSEDESSCAPTSDTWSAEHRVDDLEAAYRSAATDFADMSKDKVVAEARRLKSLVQFFESNCISMHIVESIMETAKRSWKDALPELEFPEAYKWVLPSDNHRRSAFVEKALLGRDDANALFDDVFQKTMRDFQDTYSKMQADLRAARASPS